MKVFASILQVKSRILYGRRAVGYMEPAFNDLQINRKPDKSLFSTPLRGM